MSLPQTVERENERIRQQDHRAPELKPSRLFPGQWTTWCGACMRGLYVRPDGSVRGSLLGGCSS